jgi:copper transport protein
VVVKHALFKQTTRVVLTLALLLCFAAPVWAHGLILRAEPPVGGAVADAPSVVRIWFSEPFDPSFSSLEVFSAGTQQKVDAADVKVDADGALSVSLPPSLPQGAYIVSWRVFTPSDGHQTSGSYSFGVGVPAQPGETLATERTPIGDATRFLWLSGLAIFTGVAFFRWAVPLDNPETLTRALYWPVQATRFGLGLGILGTLYVQTQALDTGVIEVLGTSWGTAWLMRAVMAAVVIASANWLMRGPSTTPALFASMFLALAASFTSHSAARLGWVGILADFTHVLGASVWVGGVMCAALVITAGERRFLVRFSVLATAAIGLLAVSGAWLAANQIGSWAGLLFTEYGRALLLKLLVAVIAFGLGAVNALRANRTVTVLETVAGITVLLCAAILTNLPPAYSQLVDSAPTRIEQTKTVSDVTATVALWPARHGTNTLEITLAQDGRLLEESTVRAQFVPVDSAAVAGSWWRCIFGQWHQYHQ